MPIPIKPIHFLAILASGVAIFSAPSCASVDVDGKRESSVDQNLAQTATSNQDGLQRRINHIEDSVKRGEISREEGDEMHEAIRSRRSRGQSSTERTFTRQEYAEAAERMRAMVEAGEVTQEDVNTRLGQMRRMMKRSDDPNKPSTERTFTRQEYAEAAERMQAMVEAGEVTQEDVNTRLGQMRRMMKRSDAKSNSEAPKDISMISLEEYRRIEKRYMAGVESGRISLAEAEKILSEKRKLIGTED